MLRKHGVEQADVLRECVRVLIQELMALEAERIGAERQAGIIELTSRGSYQTLEFRHR